MVVVIVSALATVEAAVEVTQRGAFDFLVKPFAPEELCARLRVIARRVTGGAPHLSFGNLQIDLAAKTARRDGSVIDFTAREWAILEALVLRTGRIVSRADLEALVLGFDSELASNSIEVHIFKLRSKLGKSFIETIRGLGYRVPEPSAAS
jgi:two-component system OmpR family response regulator